MTNVFAFPDTDPTGAPIIREIHVDNRGDSDAQELPDPVLLDDDFEVDDPDADYEEWVLRQMEYREPPANWEP